MGDGDFGGMWLWGRWAKVGKDLGGVREGRCFVAPQVLSTLACALFFLLVSVFDKSAL